MILPHFIAANKYWRMMSGFGQLGSTTALASVFTLLTAVGAASGVRVSTSDAAESPTETAAITAATAAFSEQLESASDTGVPQIRIEGGQARQIAFTATEDAPLPLTEDHGGLRQLTGYRINWYPVDRFLGAVDFMGVYGEDQDLVCGYLLWDVSDPDLPVLDKVVADYMIATDVAAMPEDEAHQRLLEANCAHGALAPNYAFLDVLR